MGEGVRLYDDQGHYVGSWFPTSRIAALGMKFYGVTEFVDVGKCERLEDGRFVCHVCGTVFDAGDRYCRYCGSEVIDV